MTAVPPSSRVSLDPSSCITNTKELESQSKPREDDPRAAAERTGSTAHKAVVVGEDLQVPVVGIDPRFVLPKCELPPRNELEPVEMFVANAVAEQHAQPATALPLKNYRGILEALRYKKDLAMLCKVMIALRTSKNTLNLLVSASQKHARLIHQIVRFNPFTASAATAFHSENDDVGDHDGNEDYSIADAQFHLMAALVSANSVFLVPALTALWKLLTFQITDAPEGRTLRIHAALATMMRLCPKARTEMYPIIASNAPFRMRPEGELVWYYKQSLVVLEYLPSIRGQILQLAIDRCIEMDVEIKIADGGEASIEAAAQDESNGSVTAGVFQLDMNDEENQKPQQPVGVTVDEMAGKLDSIMFLLFEHLENYVKTSRSASSDLYQMLSRVFESSILITNKSKFVQFLLLHVCGLEVTTGVDDDLASLLDEETTLYREFAGKLIEIVLDPYRATVTRQGGACYLASFISRANFVCAETVGESVDALLRWAEAYIQSLGPTSVHAADAREQCNLHALFYTVCQAAFYIMCFRGVDVVRFSRETSREGSEESELCLDFGAVRWTNICAHPLLPLRHCLESVRTEFLRISKLFSLLDDALLDRLVYDNRHHKSPRKKKRVSLINTPATLEKERLSGGVGGLGRGTNPLDSFFPFDPYLLRKSHDFIEPLYKHWDGGATEEDILDIDSMNDAELDDEQDAIVGGVDADDIEDEESQQDSDGADSDSGSDDDNEDVDSTYSRDRLLSVASNATSVSSHPEGTGVSSDVIAKKEEQAEAWKNTLKRARAPSVENGSW